MAVPLAGDPELIDPHGGLEDLQRGPAASAAPRLVRGRPHPRPAGRPIRGPLRLRAGAAHRASCCRRTDLATVSQRPGGRRAPKARRGAAGAPGLRAAGRVGPASSSSPTAPGAGRRGRRADSPREPWRASPLAPTRCLRRRWGAESARRVSWPRRSPRRRPRRSSGPAVEAGSSWRSPGRWAPSGSTATSTEWRRGPAGDRRRRPDRSRGSRRARRSGAASLRRCARSSTGRFTAERRSFARRSPRRAKIPVGRGLAASPVRYFRHDDRPVPRRARLPHGASGGPEAEARRDGPSPPLAAPSGARSLVAVVGAVVALVATGLGGEAPTRRGRRPGRRGRSPPSPRTTRPRSRRAGSHIRDRSRSSTTTRSTRRAPPTPSRSCSSRRRTSRPRCSGSTPTATRR